MKVLRVEGKGKKTFKMHWRYFLDREEERVMCNCVPWLLGVTAVENEIFIICTIFSACFFVSSDANTIYLGDKLIVISFFCQNMALTPSVFFPLFTCFLMVCLLFSCQGCVCTHHCARKREHKCCIIYHINGLSMVFSSWVYMSAPWYLDINSMMPRSDTAALNANLLLTYGCCYLRGHW